MNNDQQNNFEDIANRKKQLRLTSAQEVALTAMAKQFSHDRDSAYVALTKYLVSLNGSYRTRETKQRWHDAFVGIARRSVVAGPRIRALLTDEQFAALPADINAYFDMDELTFDRIMRAADFGTLLELITGEGID